MQVIPFGDVWYTKNKGALFAALRYIEPVSSNTVKGLDFSPLRQGSGLFFDYSTYAARNVKMLKLNFRKAIN